MKLANRFCPFTQRDCNPDCVMLLHPAVSSAHNNYCAIAVMGYDASVKRGLFSTLTHIGITDTEAPVEV